MSVRRIKRFISKRLGIASSDPLLLAEYDTPGRILEAARALRKAGYRDFDVHTPYPVHGMDQAMGLGRSIMPFIVLGGGLTGCLGGFFLQYWINAVDYPLVISGKPFASIPAFIPVTFEMTILLSAFGAVFGMLFWNGLPELYHAIFKSERFARFSSDRFFISVEAGDRCYDAEKTPSLLAEHGGHHIELLEP